jgi:hypothetical protein
MLSTGGHLPRRSTFPRLLADDVVLSDLALSLAFDTFPKGITRDLG